VKAPNLFYTIFTRLLASIEIDVNIKEFHANNLKNGMLPSLWINMNNGIPGDEEQRLVTRALESQFTSVNNAGRPIISFNESKELSPEITQIATSGNDQYYQTIYDDIVRSILSAHRISSGELFGNKVLFECVFECLITNPVESTLINCVAKSLTKVGVRAELELEDGSSPYIIFIARDHHYNNEMFSQIKENDILQVRILGQRYELNDKFISIIAELISINNYETLKADLKDVGIKQDTLKDDSKLKIKVPKTLVENIKNYSL